MRRPRSAACRPSPRPSASPGCLAQRLDAALARRAALLADPQTNVGRIVNSAADGIPGLVLERLGDVLIAQLHADRLALDEDAARSLCAAAAERLRVRAVYRKVCPRDRAAVSPALDVPHHDPNPWIGERASPELPVREAGMTFLVRPYDGYATGLFLDHRAHRALVRELAAGRRVLNTFAYTCAFTVAAAIGGAAATVSVDVSRRFLEWGKRNLAANGLALERHRFICSDVFDYYRRAARQGQRFDLVILDPPTFGRARQPRRVFVLAEDLERLVAEALPLLDPRGCLVLSVNHRGTSARRLEQVVAAAARERGRKIAHIEHPAPPEDFRGDPDAAKSVLVRLS